MNRIEITGTVEAVWDTAVVVGKENLHYVIIDTLDSGSVKFCVLVPIEWKVEPGYTAHVVGRIAQTGRELQTPGAVGVEAESAEFTASYKRSLEIPF